MRARVHCSGRTGGGRGTEKQTRAEVSSYTRKGVPVSFFFSCAAWSPCSRCCAKQPKTKRSVAAFRSVCVRVCVRGAASVQGKTKRKGKGGGADGKRRGVCRIECVRARKKGKGNSHRPKQNKRGKGAELRSTAFPRDAKRNKHTGKQTKGESGHTLLLFHQRPCFSARPPSAFLRVSYSSFR
jgi:hypothetical protein